jgi:hypothetical protein
MRVVGVVESLLGMLGFGEAFGRVCAVSQY